ncbi:MAG: CDP-glycerol glycerophosphotransferase family protein, partial [Intrasporangium sp.]|uniref:CDP-glycerol glycerophosphotransferase family protein n=1 Tax=Intrasporangium sp. TaxID=1925024 RepID=UPI003F808739
MKRFRKAKRLVQTARLQNSKAAAHRRPIKPNTVLYETYSGNGVTCHPEAIFQQLLREPDMQHLEHIWVLNDFERFPAVLRRYAGRRNVRFVKYQSLAYYRALSTSKYLINNVTFPNQFSKREGQVYIGTWHGVPLKKMGYHVEGHAADAKNIVRNFLAADYLLSAGPKMTELMYLDAFKMANIYEGAILEIGNPRVDRQSDPVNSRNELDEWMAAAGLAVDDRNIILYAPTWKGASYFNPANDAANLQATIEELERRIDTSRHRVLLKAHQVVAEAVSRNTTLGDRLIPNEVPTNVVLGASSMLITDYSSIFYDFVASGRPVFFYTPDF